MNGWLWLLAAVFAPGLATAAWVLLLAALDARNRPTPDLAPDPHGLAQLHAAIRHTRKEDTTP